MAAPKPIEIPPELRAVGLLLRDAAMKALTSAVTSGVESVASDVREKLKEFDSRLGQIEENAKHAREKRNGKRSTR